MVQCCLALVSTQVLWLQIYKNMISLSFFPSLSPSLSSLLYPSRLPLSISARVRQTSRARRSELIKSLPSTSKMEQDCNVDIVYTKMLPWEYCLFLLSSWREKERQINMQRSSACVAFYEPMPLQECFEETTTYVCSVGFFPSFRGALISCPPPLRGHAIMLPGRRAESGRLVLAFAAQPLLSSVREA